MTSTDRSSSLICLAMLSVLALSGCNDIDRIPTDLNRVEVDLLKNDGVENNSGIPVNRPADSAVANKYLVVQADRERTFVVDPPVVSSDAIVKGLAFRDGTVFVSISTRSAPLKVLDNSRECAEKGFLGLFCKSYYQRSNYTVLIGGGAEYKIRGWDSSAADESIGDGQLIFDRVPPTALSEFKIRGVGWDSGTVTLGISSEESAALAQLKEDLRSNEKSMSFRSFALLINRQSENRYASQMVMDELLSKAQKTNDPRAFSAAIDSLNDRAIASAPRVRELGIAFLESVYATSLKGTNDSVRIANFLSSEGKQLPPEKFDNIFNQGVAIESKRIDSVMEQLDAVGRPERLWLRAQGESSIEERKEKFLRSVYAAALEEKRNNRVVRSMMIYKALLEAKAAIGSNALFELQRDQEMREFLAAQFEKLRTEVAESSQRLTGEVRSLSKQLNDTMSKVVENTAATQESRADEQARNIRMTQDMFFQNRYLERAYGR